MAKEIRYTDKGAEVTVQSTNPLHFGQTITDVDRADAILVTIPLGVLKECAPTLISTKITRVGNWKLSIGWALAI